MEALTFFLERILPPLVTLFIGIFIRGRIDRKSSINANLAGIADRYMAILDSDPMDDPYYRLWALQQAGGAGLDSYADLEIVVKRIKDHGRADPTKGNWEKFGILKVMKWASENQIELRDAPRTYEAWKKDMFDLDD